MIVVVALSLALTTTVFAVVDSGLFRPLPYPDAARLFVVDPGFDGVTPIAAGERVSARDVAEWSRALPDVRFTAFVTQPLLVGVDNGVDLPMTMARVQSSFFDTIGIQPANGRFPDGAFETSAKDTPVVITHELWRSALGGSADAIGRRLVVDPSAQTTLEVVGVMPAGFVFPAAGDVSVIAPFVQTPAEQLDFQRRSLAAVLARLPPGSPLADLESQLNGIVRGLMPAYPPPRVPPAATPDMVTRAGPFSRARLVPVVEHVARRVRALYFGVLITAVVLVALACVNVAGLMVSRAFNRGHDLTVRRAIGASAADLVRLVVIETVILVSAGAAIGLAATPQLVALATRLQPADLRFFSMPSLDWRVGAFAGVMTAFAVMAIAIVPAWRTARLARIAGSAMAPAAPRRRVARTVVLALQIAGSLLLAIGGALFVTSLLTVERSDVGIDVNRVAALDIRLLPESPDRPAQASSRQALAATLLEQIRALPSVEHAAMTSSPLFTRAVRSASVSGPLASGARFFAGGQEVTSGFRDVLAPRVIAGRWFTDEEIDSRANVAVIDEVAARGWWPNAMAVGQTLRGVGREFTVIGVTAEARYYAWDLFGRVATVYQPATFARADGTQTLVVRGPDPDRAMTETIDALRRATPAVRISRSGALSTLIADSIRERRLQSWVFGSLAAAALAILAVGVLGFGAMSAVSRTREMGLRVALGATPGSVVRLLLREQIGGVVLGVTGGLALGAWSVRALEAYLYQVTPYDSRVWSAAILLVLITTLIGSLIPARRSARVDPMLTLRAE